MKLLRQGSVGEDVRRVQRALNRRMLFPNNPFTRPAMNRLAEDAIFGNATRAMVMEFQRLNGIDRDGVVGPITSFLLFPFVSFRADLKGEGRIRGRAGESPPVVAARGRSLGLGGSKAKDAPVAAGDDEQEQVSQDSDFSVSEGFKHEFKPWFVLRPDEPEGAKSSGTVTLEAVLMRKAGFEFSGGFEWSRRLPTAQGQSWTWEGAAKGTYVDTPKVGDILTPITPSASLKLAQGGTIGASVGIEASIRLLKDTLELTVGGEVSSSLDPHDGNVQIGGEVSGGLKVNLDFFRRKK